MLQLIMRLPREIDHTHDLNHQTRPAREMRRALTRARIGIILLPRESRLFPLPEDVLDEVLPQRGVHLAGFRAIRVRFTGWCLREVLYTPYIVSRCSRNEAPRSGPRRAPGGTFQ